jgi:anaerobic selenocysteine-containing dehydrogenase
MVRLVTNRVKHPYLRDTAQDELHQISWEEALELLTARLENTIEEHGKESVLLLDYFGNTGLLTLHFPQRLWNVLGATRTDHALCAKSGRDAISLHYGSDYGVQPDDLLHMHMIIFWGFNAVVSALHIWDMALEARDRNGTSIVAIDPRRTRTAKEADRWIPLRPSTDAPLALSLANYLIQTDKIDHEFIKTYTAGYERFAEEVSHWSLTRASSICGPDERVIRELGDLYADRKPGATMIGVGMQKHLQGAESTRAVALLPALVGIHRGFFYSNESGFKIDTGYLSGRHQLANDWKTVSQVDLAPLIQRGEFKFIFVYNMNPALTIPNQIPLREGLSRDDVFVVVHDTHWTETTDFADLVLPACTYLEKDDITIAWAHRYTMASRNVVPPLGESRDEIWLMRQIAERLKLDDDLLFENPWSAVKIAMKESLRGASFDDLMGGNCVELEYLPLNYYPTPSGRLEFYSTQTDNLGLSPTPQYSSLSIDSKEFILLNSAMTRYSHTQFQEVFGPIPATVRINPRDAKERNILSGDTVILSNERGQIRMQTQLAESIPPGVLWVPRQGADLDGRPTNSITLSIPQVLGGGSTFNSTVVRIEESET